MKGTLFRQEENGALEISYALTDTRVSVNFNLVKGFIKMNAMKYLKGMSKAVDSLGDEKNPDEKLYFLTQEN